MQLMKWGALCYYDQANVNGIMGITRAKEAGFDLIHYNLHKTFFLAPRRHGTRLWCFWGVRKFLKPFLPVPRVEYDGNRYYLIMTARKVLEKSVLLWATFMWLSELICGLCRWGLKG